MHYLFLIYRKKDKAVGPTEAVFANRALSPPRLNAPVLWRRPAGVVKKKTPGR